MNRRDLLLTAAAVGASAALPAFAQSSRAICYNCPPEWADWASQIKAIKDKTGITVPFDNKLASATFTKAPKRNFIDELVNEKLKALNVPPSPRCSDSEFIRRAFLDTIGTLPTAQEGP